MPVRISYTANEKYQNSPRAYYLHYIRRLREEVVGSALPFGNAMDKALNKVLENKMQGKPLKEGVLELFEETITYNEINGIKEDLRISDTIKFYKNDIDEDILIDEDEELLDKAYNTAWVSLRRKGLLMIDAYINQVMPHLKKVLSVQDTVTIQNDEGDTITGFIDFVAIFELNEEHLKQQVFDDPEERQKWLNLKKYNGQVIIFDNKTSSQKYKEDSVRNSKQLGTYFENPNSNYNADLAGYVVIPKKFRKKKGPLIPIEIIIDKVSDETISDIFNEYHDTIEGIKMGNFPCNMEVCQTLPFGCPYMKYCQCKSMEGLVELPDSKKT